ncbi:MAG: membrane associated rhomboid family serine protease [Dinoroseobacter sp.]
MQQITDLLRLTSNRLVLANIIVYGLIQALFAGQRSGFELYYWHHQDFQVWQLLSYMFLHGSFSHLAFNMIGLWSFGRVLEKVWGARRFLIFYLGCGVGAAVIHLLVAQYQVDQITQQIIAAGFTPTDVLSVINQGRDISVGSAAISREVLSELYGIYNTPAVGASGAIYGILVAFALLFPNFKIMLIFLPVPIAAKFFVPVLLLIDLSAGITGVSIFGSNIAHFAHIGGALVGFIMVRIWSGQARQ